MSKNPAPLPLQIELLATAENHPEIETLGRMLAKGFSIADIVKNKWLTDPVEKYIVFRFGASRYRIRNCPARLRQFAEVISKSRGFNGKKTPKPELRALGTTYTHSVYGFKLSIPSHLEHAGSVTIGTHTLTLHVRSNTMTGAVPASWLIDLNAAHPDDAEPAPVDAPADPLKGWSVSFGSSVVHQFTKTPAPLPRVLYSEFIRSAGKRESPMMA